MAGGKIQSDPQSLKGLTSGLDECVSQLEEESRELTDKLRSLEYRLQEKIWDTARKIDENDDQITALKSERAEKLRNGEDTGEIELRIQGLKQMIDRLEDHKMTLNRYMREIPELIQDVQRQQQGCSGTLNQGKGVVEQYLRLVESM